MPANQYKPFAVAGGANTYPYATYNASNELATGYVVGTADAQHVNTTLRQVSVAASALAQFTANNQASDMLDDGSAANFTTKFQAAIDALILASRTPTGAIFAFPTATAPTGYLACEGAAVSRATYAALFALIGTAYGAGNGTTTFNLPDLRGEFIRGWDNSRGVDSGRGIGTAQTDQLKTHTHEIVASLGGTETVTDQVGVFNTAQGDELHSSAYILPPTSGVGAETRPRNVALLFCIKT